MEKKKDKVDVLAQELKFAKILASNDQKTRNGVLKSLKEWLKTRSQSSYQFTNNDFLRLWKGLYYCMWMTDKPLVQEEMSEQLGLLIHCFPSVKVGIQFYQNFLETMCSEWFGIDQWRLDKFMMLVRRVTRQVLFALKNAEWEDEAMKLFADALNKTIFQVNKCPKGLILHICDFYIEEIAKVADGEIPEDRTHLLIEPFLVYYAKLDDQVLLKHVESTIVNQLLTQSDLGQEYQEKFDIWKQANFPTKHIDDIEVNYQVRGNKSITDDDLSDGEEDDEDERPLDPRAGRVNVVLREINFDASKFVETLESLRYKHFATSKSRKGLLRMASNFRKFDSGIYPLGVKFMPGAGNDSESDRVDMDLKAIQLAEFEKKLALGDIDSESSDFDEDLDNRKHGKLKRKNKDLTNKTKEKKQKLSKLHNERFFKNSEDFGKDNIQEEDDEDDVKEKDKDQSEAKIKKKKKSKKLTSPFNGDASSDQQVPRKIKVQKRKKSSTEVQQKGEKEDKQMKTDESPSSNGSTQPFKVSDEWSEPLKEGEVEFFVPSKKQKLKALQAQALEGDSPSTSSKSNLVLNPFAKESFQTPPTPRIKLHQNSNSTAGSSITKSTN